jgi:hypothetical protein
MLVEHLGILGAQREVDARRSTGEDGHLRATTGASNGADQQRGNDYHHREESDSSPGSSTHLLSSLFLTYPMSGSTWCGEPVTPERDGTRPYRNEARVCPSLVGIILYYNYSIIIRQGPWRRICPGCVGRQAGP